MPWPTTLITSQGSGVAVTAAAATTLLAPHSKKTLPANFFDNIGKQIYVRATGVMSSVITTPGTARFDLRLGGTVVWDSLAILLDTVAAHTNKPWWLEIMLTVQEIGATAKLFGQGYFQSEGILGTPAGMPKAGGVAMLPWNATPAVGASFDSLVTQQLDLFFTQTVATGSIQLHQFAVTSSAEFL